MVKSIKEGIRTGFIIACIYLLFVLYLLFMSDRVEKLDKRSSDEKTIYTLKLGD